METTQDVLDVLGLDETAGVRDVRRAYARRLKGIDQTLDPAGFQTLRDAYESALAWAEYRQRAQADGAEPDEPASVSAAFSETPATLSLDKPALAPIDPAEQLAATVFERLRLEVARMAGAGRLDQPQAWLAALQARLGDTELDNITARTLFEERIADLLARGWQPGNEALFPAAVAAFEWREDRRRLALFGPMGDWLNQAIDERILFDTQPPVVRGVQERIAALLRREVPATADEVLQYMDELEEVALRFPALLHVVAGSGKIGDWRALHAEHYVDAGPPRMSTRERLARVYLWLLLAVVVFFILRALYNSTQPPPLRMQPGQPIIEASAQAVVRDENRT